MNGAKRFGTYDVAVVGGGIAGIAAALAAARNGAKTILIESSFFLGGLATSGLVTIYLPLCDGDGTQVSFGLAEELLRLSIVHGIEAKNPAAWLNNGSLEERIKRRFEVQYNPHVFGIVAEKELKKAGVEIFYGATLTGANVRNGYIKSITVCTRGETFKIEAKNFIDATGDANLCAYAGEETRLSSHGNVLAAWYYEVIDGKYMLRIKGSSDYVYAQGKNNNAFVGLDGKELSDATIASHDLILSDFLKKGGVSAEHALATIATIPQVRMTRRLLGKAEIKKSDNKQYCASSVGMFGNWMARGFTFELPFGTLVGNRIKNLGVAGRCISVSDDDMWDLTRVIPVCAVSGEAIGTAAAIAKDFESVEIKALQETLRSQNVKIHMNELANANS